MTVGPRDHRPAHLGRLLERRELVLHAHRPVSLQRHAALRGGQLTRVDAAEIRDGAAGLRHRERGLPVHGLRAAVHQQDVVARGPDPEHLPAVGGLRAVPEVHALRLERVVVLAAEVVGPAHAERVHDERARVHVRVAQRGRARLERDERRVAVPGAAVKRDGVRPAAGPRERAPGPAAQDDRGRATASAADRAGRARARRAGWRARRSRATRSRADTARAAGPRTRTSPATCPGPPRPASE